MKEWLPVITFILFAACLSAFSRCSEVTRELEDADAALNIQKHIVADLQIACRADVKDTRWMRQQVRNIPMD